MKLCPFCAEEIQDAAKACKHCGRDLATGASHVQIVQPKKKTGLVAMGCAVILGLMLMGMCVNILRKTPTPTAPIAGPPTTYKPPDPVEQARIPAAVICEKAVKASLKSPATADFPMSVARNVAALGKNAYRLTSYVDSQNSFGATIRTNFTCDVTGSGGSMSGYRLKDLKLASR